MAQKRKAQEAFAAPKGQLSAFAAAKLAKKAASNKTADPANANSADTGDDNIESLPNGSQVGTDITEALLDAPVTTVERAPALAPVPLSDFQFGKQNVLKNDESSLNLLMNANDTLALVGIYDIGVVSGVATIYGSVIRPGAAIQRVYAPSTSALPLIQARQNQTEVHIHSVKDGIRKLEGLSPLYRNIWSSSGDTRSFTPIGTTGDDASQRLLSRIEVDRDAELALRTLSAKVSAESRKPRIMAVGAKSSGKSTFNRMLSNHLLSWTETKAVSYLDLDPGQPEFGPPGQLSLVEISAPILGPPFTHLASSSSSQNRLIRSHTIAATTFKEDYDLYIACASELAQHVTRDQPLIVNSCGWVSGIGAAALTNLAENLGITDVVCFDPLDPRLVTALQDSSGSVGLTIHHVQRQASHPSPRTPAEMRAMQTMSYMHHLTTQKGGLKWSGKTLNETRPWIVSYAGPNPGITAIASYGPSPHPDFLAEVLNGAIVAIVIVDSDAGDDVFMDCDTACSKQPDLDDIPRTKEDLPYLATTSEGMHLVFNPVTSTCVGLALVHSIDAEQKTLQLHTPLSEDEVEVLNSKRVVLVRGNFDPPEWAYLEELHKHGDHTSDERPWVSKQAMVGVESAVWRLRHPPMAGVMSSGR